MRLKKVRTQRLRPELHHVVSSITNAPDVSESEPTKLLSLPHVECGRLCFARKDGACKR